MDRKITKVVNTKMDSDDTSVQTTLTIDYTNCTLDDLYEKAAKSDAILWQSSARKMKVIPAMATYVSPRPGTRSVQPVVVTPEALIAKYGSVDAAIEALKAMGATAE
jgi:hypothetical protein